MTKIDFLNIYKQIYLDEVKNAANDSLRPKRSRWTDGFHTGYLSGMRIMLFWMEKDILETIPRSMNPRDYEIE